MNKDKKYDGIIKRELEKKQYRRKCRYCGWTNEIINRYNRVVCKNCGHMVYLYKKDEFKDKLRRMIK